MGAYRHGPRASRGGALPRRPPPLAGCAYAREKKAGAAALWQPVLGSFVLQQTSARAAGAGAVQAHGSVAAAAARGGRRRLGPRLPPGRQGGCCAGGHGVWRAWRLPLILGLHQHIFVQLRRVLPAQVLLHAALLQAPAAGRGKGGGRRGGMVCTACVRSHAEIGRLCQHCCCGIVQRCACAGRTRCMQRSSAAVQAGAPAQGEPPPCRAEPPHLNESLCSRKV